MHADRATCYLTLLTFALEMQDSYAPTKYYTPNQAKWITSQFFSARTMSQDATSFTSAFVLVHNAVLVVIVERLSVACRSLVPQRPK